jgi:hypothetical protein
LGFTPNGWAAAHGPWCGESGRSSLIVPPTFDPNLGLVELYLHLEPGILEE